MEKQSNNEKIVSLHGSEEQSLQLVHLKLDEFIALLETANLDNATISKMQEKFNAATERSATGIKEGYYHIHSSPDRSYNPEGFLNEYKLNSCASQKYRLARNTARIFRMVVSLLMILLGFGMIIMPAPPYFEMFTLFYLNPNDGVTIMDVISLIVAFTGVSLFISSLIKFQQP